MGKIIDAALPPTSTGYVFRGANILFTALKIGSTQASKALDGIHPTWTSTRLSISTKTLSMGALVLGASSMTLILKARVASTTCLRSF